MVEAEIEIKCPDCGKTHKAVVWVETYEWGLVTKEHTKVLGFVKDWDKYCVDSEKKELIIEE